MKNVCVIPAMNYFLADFVWKKKVNNSFFIRMKIVSEVLYRQAVLTATDGTKAIFDQPIVKKGDKMCFSNFNIEGYRQLAISRGKY